MNRSVFIFIFLVAYKSILAQSKTSVLVDNLTQNMPEAILGISVKNIDDKSVIYEYNAAINLAPASSLKLLTTATALQILGADFRFETALAYTGTINNGVLIGDLYINAGGDPTWCSKYFPKHNMQPFIDAILGLGIKKINGKIRVNVNQFEQQYLPEKWIWEDMGNYYGAAAAPLNIFDNTVEINFSSSNVDGGTTTITAVKPSLAKVTWQNHVKASNINADKAYVFAAPNQTIRFINGTIPKGRAQFVIKASMHNPTEYAVDFFKSQLNEHGIDVSNLVLDVDYSEPNQALKTIEVIQSPILADIVKVTNKESVNLFAEAILLAISKKKNGFASREQSLRLMQLYWEAKGALQKANLYDGSGLTRYNGISTDDFTNVICNMKSSENYWNLIHSLPVSGHNGSLYGMFDADLKDRVLAKSGYLDKVRSYTGIIKNREGKWLAFSIILNNYNGSAVVAKKELAKIITSFYLLS